MTKKDIINKIRTSLSYYISSNNIEDKSHYENILKESLSEFYRTVFVNREDKYSFIIETRDNENFKIPAVAVVPLLETVKVDGSTIYNLEGRIPKDYLISFGPKAYMIDPDELAAILFYSLLYYSINEIHTRIRKCLLEVAVKNDLEYDNKILNQLGGVLYYIFGTSPIFYNPVRDFSTNSLLDMFFSIDSELYNVYAKYMNNNILYKENNIMGKDTRTSSITGNKTSYYFIENAENMNDALIGVKVKEDKVVATRLYDLITKGGLEEYLQNYHIICGFKHSLKELLASSISFEKTKRFIMKGLNETAAIAELNNDDKPLFESMFTNSILNIASEHRYKLNKLIIRSQHIETEVDRTLFLTEAYKLRRNLDRLLERETVKLERSNNQKEEKLQSQRVQALENMLRELDELENNCVKMVIAPKRYGVFVEYPAGYDY